MIWRAPLSYGCTWEVGRALKRKPLYVNNDIMMIQYHY